MRSESAASKAREKPKTPRVPPNAKKMRSAAEALGFECFAENRMIHKPATLRKAATDQHAAGSVLYAAKDVDTHFLQGRHLALPSGLAFQAVWGATFSGRIVDESGGKEKLLYVDYYYSKGAQDDFGYTPQQAESLGQGRDYRYNDGETYTVSRWKVDSWAEMAKWVDDMIDVLRVDHPHISAKPKKKKDTEEEIMHELLNPKIDFSVE